MIDAIEKTALISIDTIPLRNIPALQGAIYSMKFDSKDRLWIGTKHSGLVMLDVKTNESKVFSAQNNAILGSFTDLYPGSTKSIYRVEIDDKDNIYCITDGKYSYIQDKLIKLDAKNNWQIDTFNSGLPSYKSFFEMKFDKKRQCLWVSSGSTGLWKIKDNEHVVYNSTNSALQSYTMGLDLDIDNNLWIGNDSNLFKFNGDNNWQKFSNSELPSKGYSTRVVKTDYSGSTWVLVSSFLYSFQNTKLSENISDAINQYPNIYWDMFINPQTDNIFAYGSDNLVFYNRKSKKTILINSVTSNFSNYGGNIIGIAADSKGDVWVAGRNFIGKLPPEIR